MTADICVWLPSVGEAPGVPVGHGESIFLRLNKVAPFWLEIHVILCNFGWDEKKLIMNDFGVLHASI